MPFVVWLPLLSALVGLASGYGGAYLGVRVAVTRLEVWKEITDGKVKELERISNGHHDDLLAHDFELGTVLRHLSLPRVSRQRIRD